MKIHLIRKESIKGFIRDHARSESSFEEWLGRLKGANWRAPEDIRDNYPTVDFLGNGCPRVVFDIGGNNYRMICKYVLERALCACMLAGLALMQNIPICASADCNIQLINSRNGRAEIQSH